MTCARRLAGTRTPASPTPAGSQRPDARTGRSRARRLSLVLPALAVLLGALGLGHATPASAEVLVSNFGQAQSESGNGTFSSIHAQEFTTGSNADGYTLTSIEVSLRGDYGPKQIAALTAELWSARFGPPNEEQPWFTRDGDPDRKVADLTTPSSLSSGIATFAAPNGTTLTANTDYFLVLYSSPSSLLHRPHVTLSNNEDSGAATGWSIGDFARVEHNGASPLSATLDQAWLSQDRSLLIRVNGPKATSTSNTNANLSALTAETHTSATGMFTSLTLTPSTFAATTTSYTATVGNARTHLRLNPTVAATGATVKVGKQGNMLATVASGSASAAIPLSVGANAITVEVTAADNTTNKTYTITVTRRQAQQTTNDNPPPANDDPPPTNDNPPPTDTGGGGGGGGGGGSLVSDASLRGLTLRTSAGGESFDETPALAPDFDADTLEYAASVPFSTTHARLTPRTVNPDATVRIGLRGGELAETPAGEPSPVFALAIGENVFEVEVTAEDEETAETYAVTVTRVPPPLGGLTLRASDDGESFGETLALTPAFDPSVTEYAAAAPFSMTHARLTPELGQEDATAKIGPRGGELSDAASGEPGPVLALAVGENVFEIAVTAAGGTAATYTVTVTRPAPPVSLDANAAREHLFPLLADGDGFRVRLFLTNVSAYPRNACALSLHGAGLDASRFEEHPALTVSDGALEIDSGPTGAGVALATGGAGELAFGYARLACAEPAAARLLLVRESGGVPAALANQESALPARLHRFPLLSRLGRPGLALANDGDAAAACAVEVETAAGESAGGGNLAVPAHGAAFRFVDEIVSGENGEEAETDGGAVTLTCDRPVAALGVPLTGAGVFTALGGAVPETDETGEEAEAVAARRILPLVLDGAGFRSRLEVTNRSDADNGCALEFHGAGVNAARFPSSADLVRDGFRRATFELPRDGRVAMTSFGRHSYAYGYAVLDCEGPVEAHSLLTAGDGDEADGMAPIPPARFAREVRFPVAPGLDGMALFLTNAGEAGAACTASLTPTGGEETAAAASIEVGAESTALRFLADLFALPADFAGGSAALSCDREIAAVALPATAAAAFAALPPVARGFRDDASR